MAEAGLTEGLMNFREADTSLPVAKQTSAEPGPQTLFWKVLEESGENVASLEGLLVPKPELSSPLGNEEETFCQFSVDLERLPDPGAGDKNRSPLQLGTSLLGENEPEEMLRTIPRITKGNPPVTAELHKERCDEKGSQIKVENSQEEETGLEEAHMTLAEASQWNFSEAAVTYKQRGESQGQEWKEPVKAQNENNELMEGLTAAVSKFSTMHTKEKLPLFSKYGRKYCYKSELVAMQTRGDHYDCPMMEESFLPKHQRIIIKEKPYVTSEYENGGNLTRSERNHREENPQNSPEIGKKLSYKSSNIHEGIHSEGKSYECSQCGKCFSQKEYLMNHQKIHTGEKLHECPECGKIFTSRGALMRHQIIHTGEKPYKCSHCGKCFRQKDNFMGHQKIHTGEKLHECPECGKIFTVKGALMIHQRIHTGEKPYMCSQCGKCFRRKEHLKKHQIIHTGEKLYVCPECGKSFSQSGNLMKHRRIHTGEKPYECPHCSKCFRHKDHLMGHQRIHTGEKPYKCSECGRNFSRRDKLILHQEAHKSQGSYECPKCGKSFNQKNTLMKHQSIHAGD